MDSAKYGRMRVGRCVKKNFGFVGCATDVLDYVDTMCSGRRSCKVRIFDDTFNRMKPCHEDLKSYLEATHHCVPGLYKTLKLLFIEYEKENIHSAN